jgi:flagellar FliL protein
MDDDIKNLKLDDKPEPLEKPSKKRGKKTRKKKKIKEKRARKLSLSPQFLKISVRVLIVMLVILLEVGVSYTVVTRFFMSDDAAEDAETVSEARAEEDQGVAVEDEPQQPQQAPLSSDGSQIDYGRLQGVVTLDDIVVNPAFSGGKRYFVTSIVLAVDDKEIAERVSNREPMLRDRLITLLSTKTYAWLANFTNRETLRGEILSTAGEVLQSREGIHVYFTKYVLQ